MMTYTAQKLEELRKAKEFYEKLGEKEEAERIQKLIDVFIYAVSKEEEKLKGGEKDEVESKSKTVLGG